MPTITIPRSYTQHHGQTTAALLHAEATPVKTISGDFVKMFAFDSILPRGTCIVLTLSGEKRIPFVVITNYGSSKLMRYQREIGHIFEIVVEESEEKAINTIEQMKMDHIVDANKYSSNLIDVTGAINE